MNCQFNYYAKRHVTSCHAGRWSAGAVPPPEPLYCVKAPKGEPDWERGRLTPTSTIRRGVGERGASGVEGGRVRLESADLYPLESPRPPTGGDMPRPSTGGGVPAGATRTAARVRFPALLGGGNSPPSPYDRECWRPALGRSVMRPLRGTPWLRKLISAIPRRAGVLLRPSMEKAPLKVGRRRSGRKVPDRRRLAPPGRRHNVPTPW